MSPRAKIQGPAPSKAGESANPVLPGFNDEMFATLGGAASAYLHGVVSLNREIADFVNKRLEHDAELGQALAQCKDWKQAAELQQSWFRDASEAYAANARTLMELTTKMMNEAWAPLRGPGDCGSGRAGT